MRTFRQNEPLLKAVTAPVLNEIAESVNRFNESGGRFSLGEPGGQIAAVVRVCTAETATLAAYSPVSFVGIFGGLEPTKSFSVSEATRPILQCKPYASNDDLWGVLLEPLVPGGISRAIVSGMVVCKVNVVDATHKFVRPALGQLETTAEVTNGKVIYLPPDATGLSFCVVSFSVHTTRDFICLAVVNGGSALAGYSVSLYANGLDAAPTGTGTLYVPECSAYSGLDLPEGSVLIAHSTMVVATGGSET